MLDHEPIVIDQFKGLYDRGEPDQVPLGYFPDCLNLVFENNSAKTRNNFDAEFTLANIKRIHQYRISSESLARELVLTYSGGNGKLYDKSVSLVTPLLTYSGVTDFSIAVVNDRAYITYHNGIIGDATNEVDVYDGTTLRKAAGSAPSGPSPSNSASAGVVSAGYHNFAVAFETPSGFITKPGVSGVNYVNATGGFKVDLSSIATGPSGTVRRHILATKAMTSAQFASTPNTDFSAEYFFLTTIENNTDTTLTVDFYDSELVTSADYLFDLLEEIPSGTFISVYKNRLVVGGESANKSWVRVSLPGEPESFDSVDGLFDVRPNEAGAVLNAIEYRSQLVITKNNKTYITADNGDVPSSWEVLSIDKGIGAGVFGISEVLDITGSSTDQFIVASHSGIYVFVGYYVKPELSFNIAKYWERINWDYFNLVQVVNDSINKKLYISLPLDSATACSHILVGDYQDGLNPDSIRWMPWEDNQVNSIYCYVKSNNTPILRYADTVGVKEYSESVMADARIMFKTAYMSPGQINDGSVNHFGHIRLRITGYDTTIGQTSSIFLTLYGLDDVSPVSLSAITLTGLPNQEVGRKINFINERMSIKFETDVTATTFSIRKIVVFAKKLWQARYDQ